LGIAAKNFGLPQLGLLDSITDLNLGGISGGGDQVGLKGWTASGAKATTLAAITASNIKDVITAATSALGGSEDDVVLVKITSGALSGRSFLLADTDGSDSKPEYLVQVTGVTGTLDVGDMFNI
jgi:hypothetical protein